ncbi:gamma-glutamylcyclotransferase family protein [Blastopirellula retiformator]|uniref:AIG2-like family protein n=1 Tax=Blastopirellula retiformator TaxID=2527970 RepID=A0A5C5UWU2_9BACT|nr:gamma-glutamylcyclotransferase family protein [Blastopirellula retiformator]TWT30103.1 AIG2-like family protein [Blastopirellula retiformator]
MANEIAAMFAYGTLKRGEEREKLWPARPLTVVTAFTQGRLYELGEYPGLVRGEDRVQGELWIFKHRDIQRVLEVLDEVEDYPRLYLREPFDCETFDGQAISATAYICAQTDPLTEEMRILPDEQGIVNWKPAGGRFQSIL